MFEFLLTHLSRGVTQEQQQICHLADFYSHTSREVWQWWLLTVWKPLLFLLTHLSRGVTTDTTLCLGIPRISTHTPLARCDGKRRILWVGYRISTHTPLARCDKTTTATSTGLFISTHTPLARCDFQNGLQPLVTKISTHTPLARCDKTKPSIKTTANKFLLTHLSRGVTVLIQKKRLN